MLQMKIIKRCWKNPFQNQHDICRKLLFNVFTNKQVANEEAGLEVERD